MRAHYICRNVRVKLGEADASRSGEITGRSPDENHQDSGQGARYDAHQDQDDAADNPPLVPLSPSGLQGSLGLTLTPISSAARTNQSQLSAGAQPRVNRRVQFSEYVQSKCDHFVLRSVSS